MKHLLLSAFIGAALIATASVDAAVLRCDNCSAEQMRNKAKLAGNGEHFVLSAPNGLARAYVVEREPGLDLVEDVPPPLHVIKAALGLQEMFLQSYGTLKVRVREPAASQGFA
jgi:hypothetical protein